MSSRRARGWWQRPARRLSLAWVSLGIVLSGCGSGPPPPSTATPTTRAAASASVPSSAKSNVSIDPNAPLTQSVNAAFDPPFRLRIPGDWTSALRDAAAFQIYAGAEDFEVTFDHAYKGKESVDAAIARLERTSRVKAGDITEVVVGGKKGKAFVAASDGPIQFTDSGFHTNWAGKSEVIAIPASDGTTITIFLTAGADPGQGLETLGPLARRIFQTVEWQ